MKKLKSIFLLLLVLTLYGCTPETFISTEEIPVTEVSTEITTEESTWEGTVNDYDHFDFSMVPEYSGEPVSIIHDNTPFFTTEEISDIVFETYSPLDEMGRCGVAYADICSDIMPTEERGEIGSVKPSGWNQAKYDMETTGMDSPYLYNRCHLIAFELAGENANECNLITGTRYMNINGMLPYENQVAKYVKRTDHHVLYRVTPVFLDNELLARGVLIEAASVEDNDCIFCVYCYNVQPGVTINYSDGSSEGAEFTGSNVSGTVFWTESGSCYHKDENCQALKKSKNILSGSISDCPKDRACSICYN